ncbi:MAG TPA: DUF4111 domain-containing protein [Candidatus Corynebacterium avicola]|uniref:DUF4111 domain-containing protein n=1 Tax=Candidatus Corynebacterium avicola TaxID=2838527 RepID=A0A9D1RM89_9CORY|nr:DUF4111 domain-containing protein [Candidatus Corynebacterium avicola]
MPPNAPLPASIDRAVTSYLAAADRLLPGAGTDLAVAGSTALGAYRDGASDIDLVAVLDDQWRGRRDLIPRLRLLHLSQGPRILGRLVRGLGVSATCNVSFVWNSELRLPVSQLRPVASHVGELFQPQGSFDVNPVVWHELVNGGITVRGRDVAEWGLDPEPDRLKPWVRKNLQFYWTSLADKAEHGRLPFRASRVEWCLLGPARMHATLSTGDIISKDAAGDYALDAFPQHAPILHVALAHLRQQDIPTDPPREQWREMTVVAMREIIADA